MMLKPWVRETMQRHFGQNIYSLPLDGDMHMVYYRKDVFQANGLAAPKTWDDYLAAAKALQGKDLNGDGEADYGDLNLRCHARVRRRPP